MTEAEGLSHVQIGFPSDMHARMPRSCQILTALTETCRFLLEMKYVNEVVHAASMNLVVELLPLKVSID